MGFVEVHDDQADCRLTGKVIKISAELNHGFLRRVYLCGDVSAVPQLAEGPVLCSRARDLETLGGSGWRRPPLPGPCCPVLPRRNQTKKSVSKPAQHHGSSGSATGALSYGGWLPCRAVDVALMCLFNPGLPPRRQTHLSTRRPATKGTFRADPGEQTQGNSGKGRMLQARTMLGFIRHVGAGGRQPGCKLLFPDRPGRTDGRPLGTGAPARLPGARVVAWTLRVQAISGLVFPFGDPVLAGCRLVVAAQKESRSQSSTLLSMSSRSSGAPEPPGSRQTSPTSGRGNRGAVT